MLKAAYSAAQFLLRGYKDMMFHPKERTVLGNVPGSALRDGPDL